MPTRVYISIDRCEIVSWANSKSHHTVSHRTAACRCGAEQSRRNNAAGSTCADSWGMNFYFFVNIAVQSEAGVSEFAFSI
jgi:hypothetical protein